MLEVLFVGRAVPGTYQAGLTNAALTVTSNLAAASGSEPSGFGYARITIPQNGTGWPTEGLVSSHWTITGAPLVWTASGGTIGPFQNVFLTDGSILIAFWNTVATSILDTNSLTFTPSIEQTSV